MRVEASAGTVGEQHGDARYVDAYISEFEHRTPLIRLVFGEDVGQIGDMNVAVLSMEVETAGALLEKLGGLLARYEAKTLTPQDDWNTEDEDDDGST